MAELAKIRTGTGELLPMLKEQMLLDTAVPDDRAADVLHVSDLVHNGTCYRAVTARMLGLPLPEEPFSFQRENIFAEGNTIHRKWQHRMRRTRKLYGQWRCIICGKTETGLEPSPHWMICTTPDMHHIWEYDEIPLYWEPLMLAGHADGGIGTRIVELKSIGTGTLRFEAPRILEANTITRHGRAVLDMEGIWDSIRRPFPSHIRQGALYCWLARQLGLPFDHVVFIYEFKPNQQVKEFAVRPSMDIIRPMLDQAELVAAAVRERRLLGCPSGGCRKCEGTDANGLQENVVTAGRDREPGSSRAPGKPGDQPARRAVVTAAPGGTPPDTAEPPGTGRRGADGPVPAGQPVAEIPAPPAGDGGNRRIIRRKGDAGQGSHSPVQERREDSSRDESRRPAGRIVRRSMQPSC